MNRKGLLGIAAAIFFAAFALTDCRAVEETAAVNRESDIERELETEDSISDNTAAQEAAPTPEGTVSENDAEAAVPRPNPVKVKGIYVSGPVAGTQKMDDLIQLVEETELNAMVIDIKNDEGRVTYRMQSDRVVEIDSGIRYIPDIEELVKKCKEKNIYLIGRIVAFKDPYLAEKKPELSLKTQEGEIFRDKNGLAWVNPYRKEVWDYLMEIGTEAAAAGFDEIQFDYIRFSTDLKADRLDFGEQALEKDKIEIITEFTQYAYETLAPLGVYVSADVYGTVIDNKGDQKIVGQDYQQMAKYLDYISPMIYPSHYGPGSYGIAVPDAKPYDTILAALKASKTMLGGQPKTEETEGMEGTEGTASEEETEAPEETGTEEETGTPEETTPEEQTGTPEDAQYCAEVRPWLQSFTASWVSGHINYGPKAIRAQIDAVYDAGYEEWILWNAAVNYQKSSLLPAETVQDDGAE